MGPATAGAKLTVVCGSAACNTAASITAPINRDPTHGNRMADTFDLSRRQRFRLRNAQRQQTRDDEARAAERERIDRRTAKECPEQETQDRGGYHLRQHDEEIEHAHVEAHLLRRHAIGQERVRERENRRPGEAHAEHADEQPAWLTNDDDRKEPGATE